MVDFMFSASHTQQLKQKVTVNILLMYAQYIHNVFGLFHTCHKPP